MFHIAIQRLTIKLISCVYTFLSNQEYSMTRLPLTLVVHEILSRVPARTVVQCKCLSKECYAMLSSTTFGPHVFSSLTDCTSFMDTLGDTKYVTKFRPSLEDPFEKMLIHFHERVKRSSGPTIPTYMTNGTKISFISIYLCMEAEGGYSRSFDQRKWQQLATELGTTIDYARELHDVYHKYIGPIVLVHENTSHQRVNRTNPKKRRFISARRDFPPGCGPVA